MKNFLKLLLAVCISVFGVHHCFAQSEVKPVTEPSSSDYMITFEDPAQNDYWVCTFQLLWNDLMDKIVKGPVQFTAGNPKIADILNRQGFKEIMLSPDSYYKVMDHPSVALKKQIEAETLKRFNEKSDILHLFRFPEKPDMNSYFLYTMLVKKFEFVPVFDELTPSGFNNDGQKYKFFGVDQKSAPDIRKNVHVLFYENENEYAIKLKNNQKEDVILYRTDSDKNFDELYRSLENRFKTLGVGFGSQDTLRVPFIKVDKTVYYDILCNKAIKGTNFTISKAIQTIKFDMDNKGGKLKSEAAMMVTSSALPGKMPTVRHYNFDKNFVLFMKESEKTKPYFALRVKNAQFLVPAGE